MSAGIISKARESASVILYTHLTTTQIDNEANVFKKLGVSIAIIVILLIASYPLQKRETAKQICRNLTTANLISADDCYISTNYADFIPVMFPIGSTRNYVETGMQGFYEDGNGHYILRRIGPFTRYGWLLSFHVRFNFDSENKLYEFDYKAF